MAKLNQREAEAQWEDIRTAVKDAVLSDVEVSMRLCEFRDGGGVKAMGFDRKDKPTAYMAAVLGMTERHIRRRYAIGRVAIQLKAANFDLDRMDGKSLLTAVPLLEGRGQVIKAAEAALKDGRAEVVRRAKEAKKNPPPSTPLEPAVFSKQVRTMLPPSPPKSKAVKQVERLTKLADSLKAMRIDFVFLMADVDPIPAAGEKFAGALDGVDRDLKALARAMSKL